MLKLAHRCRVTLAQETKPRGERWIEFSAPATTLETVNLSRGQLAVPMLIATVGALSAQSDWDEPFPPHRIADNLYYVG